MGDAADSRTNEGGAVVADRKSGENSRGGGASGGDGAGRRQKRGKPVTRRSFFDIYKRGQGTYTRGGTAIGAMILILAGTNFVFQQMSIYVDPNKGWTRAVQVVVSLVFLVGLSLLTFWVVGVSRKACDFMIATEGEMKKVNWSSRREIVGSTKVVIMFTILLAVILFVVDLAFMSFFAWINVLREAPSILQILLGGGR